MAFFPWRDDYSVGVEELDRQHRRLVGYLNELYEAMKAGEGRETLFKVLDGLLQYTKTHFDEEERRMERAAYPELAEHREKHRKMAEYVLKLRRDFKDGALTSPIQITNFLKDWLGKHILETDQRYAPYLQQS